MRALLIVLALLAGAGAGLLQRGPVELAGYRVSLRGALPTLAPLAELPAPPAAPQGARAQWAFDLAVALGNPAPSAETVALIVAWTRAEDGDDAGALARHNPLNTTEDTGAVLVFNSHGVKGYATRADGLAATVRTLGYDYAGYQDIREGLSTNDPARALAGLYASPWGTHAALVEQVWRELLAAPAIGGGGGPWGSPLGEANVTLTQGYGVGTHAPAATWGGVDLVLATGQTLGAPVYATIDGEARPSETWPCGVGVELVGAGWRLLHCHLSAVGASGPVRRGDVIGYVGASGQATGPHLHYEMWRDGQNVDPCGYLDVC